MKNEFVGLLVEDSQSLLVGLLAILKSGNCIIPISPGFPVERIEFIAADCRIKLIVTDKQNLALAQQVAQRSSCLEKIICIDDIEFKNKHKLSRTSAGTTDEDMNKPCYAIYTSGSTGKPKGVPITYRNLLPLLTWFLDYFKLSWNTRVLQNLSYTFDFGIFELLTTLLAGGILYFFNKKELSDLNEYVDFIHLHQINCIHTTPSFFNNITGLERTLSPLKLVHLGGEALNRKLIEETAKLVGENCYIYNGYGPTETTINSSIYSMKTTGGKLMNIPDNIPIGKPSANNIIFILDAQGHFQPVGLTGELYIAGDGVAAGYLNKPELTAEKFNRSYRSNKTYILYKTGDLGRWLPDPAARGAYIIEFLGRMDHQVKVRGFRIELGEIENRLLNHEEIKKCAVTVREGEKGTQYLCAYIVLRSPLAARSAFSAGTLREYLAKDLPDYMIPSHFVTVDKMPHTSSGKIDLKALPEPHLETGAGYIAPRDEVEEKLARIWAEVLDIEKDKISIDSNFFALGGHSLKATGMINRIYKQMGIELPLSEIFKTPTLSKMALYLRQKAKKSNALSIEPSEKKEYYELSPAQERFFLFQQMDPAGVSYNIPHILYMEGPVLKEKIETTAGELIRRHDILRTSFQFVCGEPVQKVRPIEEVAFILEYEELPFTGDLAASKQVPSFIMARQEDFIRPFNLSHSPLMRMKLVKVTAAAHFLMFDIHHIIADGISVSIFIEEFQALYNEEKLPALSIQYKDFISWFKWKRERKPINDLNKILKKAEPVSPGEALNLPTDYMKTATPSYEGRVISFEIAPGEKDALFSFSQQRETTFYMVLLSIFNIFLAGISGQENIVLGSPMAGRLHQDLEGVMGLFINTLVLRNFPTGEKRFADFLAEVKESALQAFENQEYQYECLVEEILPGRGAGRNPLFDVMFVLQNMKTPAIQMPGLKITQYHDQGWTSKFDMTLYCEEHHNYLFLWEYNISLFKEETIRRFIRYFKRVITQAAADPWITISQIELLPEEEKQEMLYIYNDTTVDYPQDKTIAAWFREQAFRTPGSTAVIKIAQDADSAESAGSVKNVKKMTVSYRQLQEEVNCLARLLRKYGLKTGTVAGIMMERSAEALVAILGVLTAGGAYAPIDPDYPPNRISAMMESSRADFLLTNRTVTPAISSPRSHPYTLLSLADKEIAAERKLQPADDFEPSCGPGDLIYIIFTSGSTGQPKGAGVYHRGFMNLMHWFVTDFNLGNRDANLWLTSLSFDLTQKNLYASLLTGGTLYIPPFNYFDPQSLLRGIHDNRVTWINCTPSMFYKLVEYETTAEKKQLISLRYVFLGGEPISIFSLIDWLESKECRAEIVNTYGPTECTDICNAYRIQEPRKFREQNIPVGKPIYNVQLFVVDKYLRLTPLGVAGELLIGGAGVGSGYVDDRDLTNRKFIRYSFAGEMPRLLYRTGDLVKRFPDGNIEFLGRLDHQVKVRGFRIELGEIENRLLNHPKVREAVVITRESEGSEDKYICAYIVPAILHQEVPPVSTVSIMATELRDYLAADLPDYMVPSYFVVLEKMPLNPNGKVDRKALPEPERSFAQNYVPPQNESENVLVGIWSEVLGLDRKKIGIHDNFFHIGGHSLKAAALSRQIYKAFSVDIPIVELYRSPTIKNLSNYIERTGKIFFLPLQPAEEKEYYPLSSAQKRLYLLQQADTSGNVYNMPTTFSIEGQLKKEKLFNACKELTRRHESFRTCFVQVEGEPVQRIYPSVDFEIEYYNLATEGTEIRDHQFLSIIQRFIRPFDLSQAPLLRAAIFETGVEKHILVFDMHHIISDGTSMGILIQDFMAFYEEKAPVPVSSQFQYKDYVQWQCSRAWQESLAAAEVYWLEQLRGAGNRPPLKLPADFSRPPVRNSAGNTFEFELSSRETAGLKQLAKEEKTTLFMLLLALYFVLLARLSGQDDITVGTPVAGRYREEFQYIIGMFVNTLAIRHQPKLDRTFKDFLKEVKENTLNIFKYQEYPFERLVEKLEPVLENGRNPLFDVMFTFQNIDMLAFHIPGLTLKPYAYENKTAKFDLNLICSESAETLLFTLEYSTNLFKADTISRFAGYFTDIIAAVLENRDKKMGDISMSLEFTESKSALSLEAAGNFGL